MKYSSVIACAALAAVCFAPMLSATPEMDEAVRLASRNSKAGLDAICLATYKAVKADPENADKIFEAVLGQRADWKASEVYAIFRSVLLARPDLIEEIELLVTTHRSGNGGKNAADTGDEGQLVGASTTLSPMLGRLVTVLYDASLAPGVADEALNMTVAVIAGTLAFSYQGAFDGIGINTNLVPTPFPMSEEPARPANSGNNNGAGTNN